MIKMIDKIGKVLALNLPHTRCESANLRTCEEGIASWNVECQVRAGSLAGCPIQLLQEVQRLNEATDEKLAANLATSERRHGELSTVRELRTAVLGGKATCGG